MPDFLLNDRSAMRGITGDPFTRRHSVVALSRLRTWLPKYVYLDDDP